MGMLNRGLSRITPDASVALRGLAVVVLGLFLMTTVPQPAAGSTVAVKITQVTVSSGVNLSAVGPSPSITGDGTRVAFDSNADLTGGNPDGIRAIFLADLRTDPPTFTQVTSSAAGLTFSTRPSINGDGTRIAFASSVLTGGFNVNEIFVADLTTTPPTLTQITGGSPGVLASGAPSISADGRRVAFVSGQPFLGHAEVFVGDLTTSPPTITQVTSSPSGLGSGSPSISADGTRLAFVSDGNLTGGNADGSLEVFLADLTTTPVTFTQVTSSLTGFSVQPSLSSDGTRVAFASNANLTGLNPDRSAEIFLADLTTGPPTVTQLTSGAGSDVFRITLSLSADGTRVAFTSSADLTGGNPDGSAEIFLADTTSIPLRLTQVTNGSSATVDSLHPSITADGPRIAFASTANPTGDNADGSAEIFLGDVVDVQQVVSELPDTAFGSGANGLRNALEGHLQDIDRLIQEGQIAQAIQKLETLRRRVDGCGTSADTNDWIVDCTAQIEVRELIDALIANLSS